MSANDTSSSKDTYCFSGNISGVTECYRPRRTQAHLHQFQVHWFCHLTAFEPAWRYWCWTSLTLGLLFSESPGLHSTTWQLRSWASLSPSFSKDYGFFWGMGMAKSLMWLGPKLHPQTPLPINRAERNNSNKNIRNGSCVTLKDSAYSHVTSPANCFTVNYTWKGRPKTAATGVTIHRSLMNYQRHLWLTAFLQGTDSLKQQSLELTALLMLWDWIKTKPVTPLLFWDCSSLQSLLALSSGITAAVDTCL